jgi:hypothetical protein
MSLAKAALKNALIELLLLKEEEENKSIYRTISHR